MRQDFWLLMRYVRQEWAGWSGLGYDGSGLGGVGLGRMGVGWAKVGGNGFVEWDYVTLKYECVSVS